LFHRPTSHAGSARQAEAERTFDEHDESGREEDSLCSTARHRSLVEKEGHADAHTHRAPRPATGRALRYRGGGDSSPPPSSTAAPPNSSSGNDNIIFII
ncbi:unnamed protein product, partial [Ectocarpus sp. 12 AP-2014]